MAVAGLAAGLGAASGWAEARRVTLSGSVSSPDGARLPHATVSAKSLEDGTIWRLAADALGSFRLVLPEGRYHLSAELRGFEPEPATVELAAGHPTEIALRLRLAGIHEAVTVVASAPPEGLAVSQIRESSARDAAEALTVVAGVTKLRKGGIANDIVLRGLPSQNLTVVVDGVRILGACPNHMDPSSFHVDFSEVGRIEVAKGPFDLRNAGSLGGSISIVTQVPGDGFRLNANLATGSYGFKNPSATLSYGGDRFAALAGYSYRSSDAYRDGHRRRFTALVDYRPDTADDRAFELQTAWAKAYWRPAERHSVDLAYTRQDASHVFYPYLQMDGVYDDTDRLSLTYAAHHLPGRLRSLTARGYLTRVSHFMTNQYRNSAGTTPLGYSMGTEAQTHTLGARLEGQLGRLTIGTELLEERWDARTELAIRQYAPQHSIPDVTIGTVGLYIDLLASPSERLELTLGGRVDHARSRADASLADTDLYFAFHGTRRTERTDTLPAAKLQLRYRPSPWVALSLALGQTARAPDANERYFALRRMGTDRVGNPDLDPSRNTGLDLGLALERPGGSLRGHLFASRVDDYIAVCDRASVESVVGVGSPAARTFGNVDATLVGGELVASTRLGRRLFLDGDLSYVRGRQQARPAEGVSSKNLAEMPPLLGHVRLRFDDGTCWARIEGVLAARQGHIDTDLAEEETAGYAIANLGLGLRRGRIQITAGVHNLFDRYYVEHLSYWRDPFRSGVRVPEPGRNFFANLAAQF